MNGQTSSDNKEEVFFPPSLLKHAFDQKDIEYRWEDENDFSLGKLDVTSFTNYQSYVSIFVNRRKPSGMMAVAQIYLTQSMLESVHPHPKKSDWFLAIFERH